MIPTGDTGPPWYRHKAPSFRTSEHTHGDSSHATGASELQSTITYYSTRFRQRVIVRN